MFRLRSGPPDSAVYIMQRRPGDRRGMLYVDANNGLGLKRLSIAAGGTSPERAVFDWSKQADPHHSAAVAYSILCHVLDDPNWADQLKWQFSNAVIRKLPYEGGKLLASTVRKYVTLIELGQEAVK